MIRTCTRCGQTYDPAEAFFRQALTTAVAKKYRRAICIGCELSARTEQKRANRPKEKARRTLHSHADKYIKKGIVSSRAEFAQRFGWNLDQMAHDLCHASENGCPYCHQLFSEMAHGWADLTLDIIHPGILPYYESNARWVCMTCNREKQKTPPDLWGAKLQCWKQWREWHEKSKQSRWAGLPLFEAMGVE